SIPPRTSTRTPSQPLPRPPAGATSAPGTRRSWRRSTPPSTPWSRWSRRGRPCAQPGRCSTGPWPWRCSAGHCCWQPGSGGVTMAEWLAPLADFHFLRPLWLLALVPLTALLWLAHRHRERGGPWRRVIAPALLPLLVGDGDGPTSRGRRLGAAMAAASLLACVALAGPTWERIPLPANKQNSALVILFDLSPSMLAEDLKPNRLTRARLKTIDLLNRHREGSVALVAWAGDAHVVAPLTEDAGTLIALLPALEPDIMPEAGSNPELALEKGLVLAMNGGHLAGDILFVTDG